jgi:hypothetical protein
MPLEKADGVFRRRKTRLKKASCGNLAKSGSSWLPRSRSGCPAPPCPQMPSSRFTGEDCRRSEGKAKTDLAG